MKKIRCRVEYRRFSNNQLPKFITLIEGGLYANPTTFASPTILINDFKIIESDYINAVGKYTNAPKIEKTNMLVAKEKMIAALDKLAIYVDSIADGNTDIIMLSGFTPSKIINEKRKPLGIYDKFDIIRRQNYGEVKVKIDSYSSEKGIRYMVLCTKQPQLPENFMVNGVFDFSVLPDAKFALNNGRIKLFTNLEAGMVYYFYLFISNPVSISPPSLPKSFKM